MIDKSQVNKYFKDALFNAGIFPSNGYDWENIVRGDDNPYPDLWVSINYLAVSEGYSDSVNGDESQGIMQFTLHTKIGSSTQEISDASVAVGNLFPTATVIETDDYSISIESTSESQRGKISNDSKWYTIIIDVNYRAYE